MADIISKKIDEKPTLMLPSIMKHVQQIKILKDKMDIMD